MICAVIAAGCGISEEPEAAESAPGATPVSALEGSTPEVALAATHTITWDRYSLMIDGQRVFVWSGEFHPFRVPSPSLWRDVLQKLKANGYNGVSIYFDWGYHSASRGVYDFTGVRDMDQVLALAQEVGLYVIARPGPYINAEVDGGGFPGWLTTVADRARTDGAGYLAATDEWQAHIDPILARHQITNGTGSIILYQIENELASTGTSQLNYLTHLRDRARANGITVPIFHNDKGRNGFWVPAGSAASGTVVGPVDLYAFDGYPGGTCHSDNTTGGPSVAPDWGIWGTGGAKGGATASPNTPGFAAEFGGGWFDFWGGSGSYPCMAQREGPGYERVFYGTNIANRLTIQNFYMTVGATSWGWLPAPVVYTSYDYGAGLSEARQTRPKLSTMKELGLFLQSVAPVTKQDKATAVTPSSTAVKVYHNVNPDTQTHFYVATHNPSSATSNDSFSFPINTPDGAYTASLVLNGQDAKILVANFSFGGQHLVYSTSEIETVMRQGSTDLLLLYGRTNEPGRTVLRYATQPTVTVLAGSVTSAFSNGDLTLDYAHSALAQIRITGGGRDTMSLLIARQSFADAMWRQDTSAGPILIRGPQLVRTATVSGSTLALTGDTAAASSLEIWAPAAISAVTWNGAAISMRRTSAGSLAAVSQLPGPDAFALPDLSAATWRFSVESPEAAASFDDATWTAATRTTTTSTTPPPAGQRVLTADDYGFHHGDVWYRGRYTGAAASIDLRYGGGGAGMLQAWVDGVYLGQNVLATGTTTPSTTGTVAFSVPTAQRTGGAHVVSVMVRNDSHNEDGGVNDAQKEGRGLISSTLTTATGASIVVSWKLQGNAGGESIADPVRGPLNNGGLFGERNRWHLPGFPDGSWATRPVPDATAVAGTSWYRTQFTLAVPAGHDASLGITIGDPTVRVSGGAYRVLIFVNGWNMGQYIANVGPQHTFVVPNGILDPRGTNTLALAVTSNGGTTDRLERVALTNLGTVRGGVPLSLVNSPRF
ncbi:MAG TPA: beta-galactosidase [Kofleriaceae bacterium]|nr:beta-galactosidase [Kofleriaceae bacterium]